MIVPSITRAAPRAWRGCLVDLAASPQAATIMPTTKANTFGQNVDHHPNGLAGHELAMLHPTGKTTRKLETMREAPRISSASLVTAVLILFRPCISLLLANLGL